MQHSDRLRRAGATPQELAQLEAEFAALTPAGQESQETHFVALAEGDLIAYLQGLRDAGHFEQDEAPEPEPVQEPVDESGPDAPPDAPAE